MVFIDIVEIVELQGVVISDCVLVYVNGVASGLVST